MPTYYRSDQARIQVTVPGIALDTVSWDVMQGGDNVAPSTNTLPGGMLPAVELGGVPRRNPLTIERLWSDFLIGVFKQLDARAGNLPLTASYIVLDANGKPVPSAGASITYTGVLLEVARPDYDSTSSNDARLRLTVGLHGSIS